MYVTLVRTMVGLCVLFGITMLSGCGQQGPSPEMQRVIARLADAPTGTCVEVGLAYDPLPSRRGIIHKRNSGEIWVTINGIDPVRMSSSVREVKTIIEPGQDGWEHCVKQFALRG